MTFEELKNGMKDLFSSLGAKTSDSNYAVGLFDKTSAEPKGIMDFASLAKELGAYGKYPTATLTIQAGQTVSWINGSGDSDHTYPAILTIFTEFQAISSLVNCGYNSGTPEIISTSDASAIKTDDTATVLKITKNKTYSSTINFTNKRSEPLTIFIYR